MIKPSKNKLSTVVGRTFVALIAHQIAMPVVAHAAEQAELDTIVVTAQKRTENLQKVPISASAISGQQLTESSVVKLQDVAKIVPNLVIHDENGWGVPEFVMRGIGVQSSARNTESAVMLYMDEAVLNLTTGRAGQLFDMQRIEVLRGPQGTLYGKNATAGAINFITRKPDEERAYNASFTVGNFDEYGVEAGVQTPLGNGLSVRVAGIRNYSKGYGFNRVLNKRVNGLDKWGARVGLRYQTDNLDVFFKVYADGLNNAGTNTALHIGVNANGSPRPNRDNRLTGYIQPGIDVHDESLDNLHIRNRGAALNINYDFPGLTFTSITGFHRTSQAVAADIDGSPFRIADLPLTLFRGKQYSQELRLASSNDGPFSWIAGASYYHHSLHDQQNFAIGAFPLMIQLHDEKTTSYAGFADATYKLDNGLSFTAGVRVTHDKKPVHQHTAPGAPNFFIGAYDQTDSRTWTEPTYRAVLNYQLDRASMLYLSYNRGYRAGAWDAGFHVNRDQLKPTNPEFVDSIEGGVKTTLFDNHLRLAVSGFYTKYADMQVNVFNAPIGFAIRNAGAARIYGLEAEGVLRLTSNFDINFSGNLTDAKYTDFAQLGGGNLKGTKLGYTPSYSFKVGPEYRIPVGGGEIFISPDLSVYGKTRASAVVNAFGLDIQKAYARVDGQLGYRADAGYSVFAWVKNATDVRYLVETANNITSGFWNRYLSAPRSFGMTATINF